MPDTTRLLHTPAAGQRCGGVCVRSAYARLRRRQITSACARAAAAQLPHGSLLTRMRVVHQHPHTPSPTPCAPCDLTCTLARRNPWMWLVGWWQRPAGVASRLAVVTWAWAPGLGRRSVTSHPVLSHSCGNSPHTCQFSRIAQPLQPLRPTQWLRDSPTPNRTNPQTSPPTQHTIAPCKASPSRQMSALLAHGRGTHHALPARVIAGGRRVPLARPCLAAAPTHAARVAAAPVRGAPLAQAGSRRRSSAQHRPNAAAAVSGASWRWQGYCVPHKARSCASAAFAKATCGRRGVAAQLEARQRPAARAIMRGILMWGPRSP